MYSMNNAAKIVLGFLITAAVSAGVSYLTISKVQSSNLKYDSFGNNIHTVALNTSSGVQTDFTVAAEQSVNAVVHISVKSIQEVNSSMDIFQQFFGNQGQQIPQKREQMGYGSGVIISSDGYIVTNNHVVNGAEEVTVTLNEQTDYKAKVVGTDPNTDIALIKIEAKNLPVIPFGNSDELKLGEWVLAVGNPLNLASTVTAGIVSAKARNLGIIDSERQQNNPFRQRDTSQPNSMSLESFIQTDVADNPGNSGGAVVNLKGELVGINTAIMSPTGAYAGYSFAIPVNIVAKVVGDIKEFGSVQRAMLGVIIRNINTALANEKKIEVQDGVYVENVADRSGAREAGIEKGDIIKSINGKKVKTSSELQAIVGMFHPSDEISVVVLRDGKEKKIQVKLRNTQGGTETLKNGGIETLGAAFKELTPEQKKTFNIGSGVQVSGIVDGKFKQAGIPKGFIILKVNNVRIESVEQLEAMIEEVQKNVDQDNSVLFILGIMPNGKIKPVAIDLTE
jgi:serine protease Do